MFAIYAVVCQLVGAFTIGYCVGGYVMEIIFRTINHIKSKKDFVKTRKRL